MSTGTKRVVWRVAIFALLGLLMEVFFTAASSARHGNWNLHGGTSPWMMLDYGLLGVAVMPLGAALKRMGIPLAVRAAVYMAGIFAVELVSGWLFDLCGLSIWNYSDLAYNFHGYITLTFAPFWYVLGLFVELLNRRVDAMALVLTHGWTAEEITEQLQGKP